jgi:hypothetical protein
MRADLPEQIRFEFPRWSQAEAVSVSAQPREDKPLPCLPDFYSLDVQEEIGPDGREFTHRLMSRNLQGPFLTTAAISGRFASGKLLLRLTGSTAELGLAYNLFALRYSTEAASIAWHDYTAKCTSPGVSVFPRSSFDLTSIKVAEFEGKVGRLLVWGVL